MTLNELEEIAAVRSVNQAEALSACASSGRSLSHLLDEMSLQIAQRYLSNVISFTHADAVMNGLTQVIILGGNDGMASDFAWAVYLAFDAGEFHHPGDDAAVDPEVTYTRPQLLEALAARTRDEAEQAMGPLT